MANIRTVTIIVAGLTLLLGGCSTGETMHTAAIRESLLINPSILVKSSEDQTLYQYANPKVVMKEYKKVIIDPVIISIAAEIDAASLDNYQKLVNNAYILLIEELKKDYQIVQSPEPNTMRAQMAIIEADASKPVKSFISTILPINPGADLEKYSTTDKPMTTGKISGEFKISDAISGTLLGAEIDRHIEGNAAQGIWNTWDNTDEALKYWAKKARFVLCDRKIGNVCDKPYFLKSFHGS